MILIAAQQIVGRERRCVNRKDEGGGMNYRAAASTPLLGRCDGSRSEPVLRLISLAVMLFALLIVRADRHIIRQLRRAEATSTDTAIDLEVPPALGSWRLRRLIDAGAVAATADRRFYLRVPGYEAFRRGRRRRVLIAVGLSLAALAVAMLSKRAG